MTTRLYQFNNKETMKKLLLLTITLTLLLAACGSSAESATAEVPAAQLDPNARQLDLSTKLALGTLKLENTDLAVASDQAADLLPLWQVFSNMSGSDTASQVEIEALIQQIQDTMTPEQIAAIENMKLSQADIFSTMQELGLVEAPQVNAEGTPQAGGFGNGQRRNGGDFPGGGPEGGFAGGGPPDGGPGGGFGGEGLSPDQIATAQARRAENGGGNFGNRLMTPLVKAVINLLESKTGS